ncbi:hypothetical protein cce_4535 [Crocosphaera subtropica ATCC 51142]|uniref:Uncharacterized protein n=2 Tax=Crocosphaera TaxID=263510 RepID=B1WV93_CROS5|nr:hypothetical protein cce_4535 [Crocosphaera subtropica ATCC 51142]
MMSTSTLGKKLNTINPSNEKISDVLEDNYITTMVEYVKSLYESGNISDTTCNYLIRQLYSQKIEQMIEKKVQQKLEKITLKLNQKALSWAIIELLEGK